MRLNWSRARGEISTRDDGEQEKVPKKVSGRSTGNWIVHKTYGDHPVQQAWTITHRPSGLWFAKLSTQQECVDLVEHLSRKVFGFSHYGIERIQSRKEHIQEIMYTWIEKNKLGD